MSKLYNFRDLGGLRAANGKTIRKNRLLRAAEPTDLTAEDITRLVDCGLVQIIDFRNPWEIEIAPVTKIDGASYHIFEINKDRVHKHDSLEQWYTNLNPANAETSMTDGYRAYVTMQSARTAIGDFVRACAAKTEGATLFHCHAGKDRTGFAAAVILRLLGVSDEDIFEDYLRTLEDVELRLPQTLEKRRTEMNLNETQVAAYAVIYTIKREWLEAGLAAIDEFYGSFDNYVTEGLGITADEITALRALYLE